jgi:hypothetical protein
MFGMLKSAVKAATAVVDVPVALAADVFTMGGVVTDRDKTYTEDAVGRFTQNVKDIADPDKD